MKISCFADEIAPSLADQFRVMQGLNLKGMEVRTVDDVSVMDLSERALREIRNQADDRGITITCVSSPIGKQPVSISASIVVQQVQKASQIAHILGCKSIRIFSFFNEQSMTIDEAITLSTEKLSLMADQAKKADTVLVMEGGHNTVGQTGKVAQQLFEAVDNVHLRCAFDAAAFVGSGERPFTDCLPLLMPYIEYMHIKDARFNSHQRVLPGEGDVELEKILDAVRDKDLVLSLEPHLAYAGPTRGFSGEEPFKQAHKALIDILHRLNIPFA